MKKTANRICMLAIGAMLCFGGMSMQEWKVSAEEATVVTQGTDDLAEDIVLSKNGTEAVVIEEEETPLSTKNCNVHWGVLILTAAYAGYGLYRTNARNKIIKSLEAEKALAEA